MEDAADVEWLQNHGSGASAQPEDWGDPEEWEDWSDVRRRMIHSDSGGSARSIWQACMVGDLERVLEFLHGDGVHL